MKSTPILRLIAAALFLAAAGWTAFYLADMPFNPTTAGISALIGACWLLIAWLALRNHPGRIDSATPAFIFAGFFAGAALLSPTVFANNTVKVLQSRLGFDDLVFGLLSPTAEELLKFTAVFVLCTMVFRIRRPIEAVTVAIAVGFGFAAAENTIYILQGALEHLNSDVEGALTAIGVRTAAAPWAHALYTGLSAWGLGCFLCRPDKPLQWRVGRLVGWYVVGYAAHAAFNSAAELPGEVAAVVAFFAVIAFSWIGGIWLYARSRKIGRRD